MFYWVRHGPTHQKTFTGWRDVPADLSNTDQLSALNAFLPAQALVVSSDLTRSVQTADALSQGRMRLGHMPGLREFHFGAWDGKPFDAIAERYPTDSRAYWENPGDICPPGGESWNMAAERVTTAAAHLARAFPNREIVAVAHIGAILTQVQAAKNCGAADVLQHKIDNLSVTKIDLSYAKPVVEYINHIP